MSGSRAAAFDARRGEAWTRRQRLKNDLIYGAIRAALAVVSVTPRALVRLGCRFLGLVAWVALPRERRLARERLEAGLGAPVSSRRVRGVFRGAADTLADTLFLLDPREPADRTLRIEPGSGEVFRAALDEGRGVVFLCAHLGPWERLAALFAAEGFPCATVARESYDPRLTRLYEELRAPRGVRAIYRGQPGAATAIVRELRKGRAVGFLADLPSRVPSLPTRLFGAVADLPVGPARIALARGAAVLVGTCIPGGLVRVTRLTSSDLAPGAEGERELLDRMAAALDERIALGPEAWLGLFAPPKVSGAPGPIEFATPGGLPIDSEGSS